MALVTKEFKLDLAPGKLRPVVNASQGDIGRPFMARCYWDGSPWTATGYTANIRGRKPDGTVFDYSATVDGSTVTFETTEQMTIISGPVECELVFSNDGDVIASANFVLIVEESPYNPDALSESDIEGLTDVLEGFQRLNRDSNGVVKIGDGVTASGTAEPIKGFYVHDEVTDTDGVAKVDYGAVENTPDFDAVQNGSVADLLYNVEWEQGSIGSDTGDPISASNRIRTGYIDVSNVKYLHVKPSVGYGFVVDCFFDIDTVISGLGGYYNALSNWHTDELTVALNPRIKYVRFLLSHTSGTILPSAGENLSVTAEYKLLNDVTNASETTNVFSSFANGETITLTNNFEWVQAIPGADADTINNLTTRICTGFIDIPKFAKTITLTAPDGYDCAYYLYDDNAHQLVDHYWANNYSFEVQDGQTKLIIGLRTDSNGTIVPSEGNITVTCTPSVNLADVVTNSQLATATEHKQDVDNIIPLSTVDLEWELGTLNPGSGAPGGATTRRIRSRYILVGKGTTLKTSGTSYHLIYAFDFDKNYLYDTQWTRDDITVDRDCYIRVILAKNQDAVITEEEIATVAATETIYRTFPQYLMDKEYYEPPVEIPEYFENEIDTAITTARTNIFDAGIDGDSFVFISDVHWQSNTKNSPALIKKAVDGLNLDKIICGGDLIGGGEKSAMVDLLSDCVNAYKDITRFYCLFGNHDSNTIGAPTTADNFTKSEVYALEQKQSDFVMNYGEPCYFYFDNPTTKTRYICLDTGLEGSALPSAQSDWLTATLNSTPDNYHILVFAHIIYLPTNSYHVGITKDEVYRSAFMVTVCNMLDTFNTNNQNKKVEAIFGGHMHFDADFTTTGGIPIVLIDCDTRQTFTETEPGSGIANHAAGTVNEQCFDIVSIDYANSTIKCTRVGRGSDRTFTY